MAHLLGCEDLHLAWPDKVLLDAVTLGIDEGDRIGVVGRNGDGKSSLLQLLAGRREPMGGRVTRRRGVRIGMLHQADQAPAGATVRDLVVGDVPDHEWASSPRIRDVLGGLIADLDLDAPFADLSGGQRRRVALAAVLSGDHDVLFLDEPTNHLDVEGISWLAEHLRTRWPAGSGALVVITHDRWFLDAVCTRMWEVHDGIVELFEGGYAAYVLQRVERDRIAQATETKRRNLMRKELAWLRRGAPARTSKPKFRIDAANQLIAAEPPVRDSVALTQLATARLGRDVITLEDVTVSYGAGPVLADVTWRPGPGERIGILGPNGAGKSTLLGLVTGDVRPDAGRVKRGKTVRTALLDQRLHSLEPLRSERVADVIAARRSTYSAGDEQLTPGQLLERLGFTSAQLHTPVERLSGGQRRRLQFLLTLLDEPNVLLLDEPTNDMDTDMLAAIEDLLDSWPGTLLVVSHDRYLLERVTDQQFAVLGSGLRHLPGGVDEYLRLRRAGVGSPAPDPAVDQASGPARSVAAGETEAGSDRAGPTGARRHALSKEVGAVERKLASVRGRIERLHARMAAHDPEDYVGLGSLQQDLRAEQEQQDALEEAWLELSEQLEG